MATKIGGFGLLLDGCQMAGGRRSAMTDGQVTVAFDEPVQANGYYFVTSDGDMAADPVRWVVEAAAAGNDSWVAVGAGVWAMTSAGIPYPYPELSYPTPAARSEIVWMDQRYSWPQSLLVSVGGIEWAIGLLISVIMGRIGLSEVPRAMFIACTFLDTAAAIVTAVGFHLLGDWRNEMQSWLLLWSQSVLFFGILWFEAHIVRVFAVYAVSLYCTALIIVKVIYSGTMSSALVGGLSPGPVTACVLLDAVIIYFRWRALRRARLLVEVDQGRYSHAWALVQQAPGAAAWIRELRDLVSVLSARCPENAPNQALRLTRTELPVDKSVDSPSRPNDALAQMPLTEGARAAAVVDVGSVRDGMLVMSLDQLYVQAVCLYPVLLRKVQEWATAAEGDHEVLRAHSIPGDDLPMVQVKFAGIKSVSRAVEKCIRAYSRVRKQVFHV